MDGNMFFILCAKNKTIKKLEKLFSHLKKIFMMTEICKNFYEFMILVSHFVSNYLFHSFLY